MPPLSSSTPEEAVEDGFLLRAYRARYAPSSCFSLTTLSRLLDDWAEANPWLKHVPKQVLQQCLHDFIKARAAFLTGAVTRPPGFQKANEATPTMRFPQHVHLNQDSVFLPKLGWVRFRNSFNGGLGIPPGELRSATVKFEHNHWMVSLLMKQRKADVVAVPRATLGPDAGVENTLATSTRVNLQAPIMTETEGRRIWFLERRVARCTVGSARRARAQHRLNEFRGRINRRIHDWRHNTTTTLSKNHGLIAAEDLALRNMTASAKGTVEAPGKNVARKSGLNRALLEPGFGIIYQQLAYKQAWRGHVFIQVNPAYTSQTCPQPGCGHCHPDNRPDRDHFKCVRCGHADEADLVAAENVRQRGLKDLLAAPSASALAAGHDRDCAPAAKTARGMDLSTREPNPACAAKRMQRESRSFRAGRMSSAKKNPNSCFLGVPADQHSKPSARRLEPGRPMKSYQRQLRWALSIAGAAIFGLEALAADPVVETPKPPPMVGAYFFDGWSGQSASAGQPDVVWARNAPTHVTERMLAEFPDREPIWGWRDDSLEKMERQIDLAADHGVAFFAFCWYWHDDGRALNEKAIREDSLHTSLNLFLRAKNRNRMKFCLLVANHHSFEIKGTANWQRGGEYWMSYFRDKQYLTVGGRPLLIVFNQAGGDKAGFTAMQQQVRAAGLPGLAIAGCDGAPPEMGFDLRTHYNVVPGYDTGSEQHRYAELVQANRAQWKGTPAQPYIPIVTAGWDKRPWEGPTGLNQKPGWYYPDRTPEQFAAFLWEAIKWMDQHPEQTTAERLVLIYAWNEFGEGGHIAPTKGDPDGRYLEALKSVVLRTR